MNLKNTVRRIKKRLNLIRHQDGAVAVILMYHRISEISVNPNWLAVSPDHFAEHMEYLRKSFTPLGLLEFADQLRSGMLPPRAVIVTFDDGYLDNFTHALPILESFQVPATVFVTSGYIGSHREFWWDELPRLLLQSPQPPSSLLLDIQGVHHAWCTESKSQCHEVYLELTRIFKLLPVSTQDELLNSLSSWSGLERTVRTEYKTLSVEELIKFANSDLIEIGAHTVNHPVLTTLSIQAQYDEIVNSKLALQSLLSHPVHFFAYPNGDYTEMTTAVVEQAGYYGACTVKDTGVPSKFNLFQLPRFGAGDWDLPTFQNKLSEAFHIFP